MSAAASEEPGNEWWIGRPQDVFQELPLEYRWQFTRRHPYYLMLWEYARSDLNRTDGDEERRHLLARLHLMRINVTGEPIDPAVEKLDAPAGSFAYAASGAVTPPTLLTLALALVRAMPPQSLRTLCGLIFQSANIEDDGERVAHAAHHLSSFGPPELQQAVASGLLNIDLHAPQQDINAGVRAAVDGWRRERGVGDRRRQHKLLASYLRVWDLHEGWTGDGYDVAQEQSFRQIARSLRLSSSTVADRYRAAYRYIAGRSYDPRDWLRLFQVLKFEFAGPDDPTPLPRAYQGARRSRSVRAVSEALVGRPILETSAELRSSPQVYMQDAFELQCRILEQIRLGSSNDQIIQRCELTTPRASELIEVLRRRTEGTE